MLIIFLICIIIIISVRNNYNQHYFGICQLIDTFMKAVKKELHFMKNLENDHRVRVTKLLIRQSFTSLLSQKPLESITVKELCALADINRGTFYTHYQSTQELLREIEDSMIHEINQALMTLAEKSSSPTSLVEVCTQVFQCLKNNSDMCIIMLGDYCDKSFVDGLMKLGKEACMRSYTAYFKKASPEKIEYFYAFVSSGCLGLLRKWLEEGMKTSTRDIAKMAEQIMLGGIGFLEMEPI